MIGIIVVSIVFIIVSTMFIRSYMELQADYKRLDHEVEYDEITKKYVVETPRGKRSFQSLNRALNYLEKEYKKHH